MISSVYLIRNTRLYLANEWSFCGQFYFNSKMKFGSNVNMPNNETVTLECSLNVHTLVDSCASHDKWLNIFSPDNRPPAIGNTSSCVVTPGWFKNAFLLPKYVPQFYTLFDP